MKRIIGLLLFTLIIWTFFTGCELIEPVTQAERVEMWINDYNNGNYSSMGEHFYSGMTNYATLILLDSYWSTTSDFASAFTSNFTIDTNSSTGSNTRRVTISDLSSMDMTITFRERSEDIWVIERIDYYGGSNILQ